MSWVKSGLDNYLFTPDSRVHAKLTRLAFTTLCHPFQPFIVGQRAIGPKIAAMHNIKLVFYGENQAEYGNNIKDNDKPTMNPKFFQKDDLENMKLSGIAIKELIAIYEARKDFKKTEELYLRLIMVEEKAFGPDSGELAATMSSLAGIYKAQGRFAEAEPLLKGAVAIAGKGSDND